MYGNLIEDAKIFLHNLETWEVVYIKRESKYGGTCVARDFF